MEKEGKSEKGSSRGDKQTDLVLQWGNRKRLRCVKVKKDQNSSANQSSSHDSAGKKKITFRIDRRVPAADKEYASPQPHYVNKSSSLPINSWKSSVASPEKEDRYYTTRGSMGLDDNGKVFIDQYAKEDRSVVWPKLYVTLSSKEKEADFLAMKGCKLPQRPKKRAKLIQRSILLVSPGGWLADLCKERYKVREKNASKKRPRGLKAMGSMESDSE